MSKFPVVSIEERVRRDSASSGRSPKNDSRLSTVIEVRSRGAIADPVRRTRVRSLPSLAAAILRRVSARGPWQVGILPVLLLMTAAMLIASPAIGETLRETDLNRSSKFDQGRVTSATVEVGQAQGGPVVERYEIASATPYPKGTVLEIEASLSVESGSFEIAFLLKGQPSLVLAAVPGRSAKGKAKVDVADGCSIEYRVIAKSAKGVRYALAVSPKSLAEKQAADSDACASPLAIPFVPPVAPVAPVPPVPSMPSVPPLALPSVSPAPAVRSPQASAASPVAGAAGAQTYSKEELQQNYLQYLAAEGYNPSLSNQGNVLFRREGRTYLIVVDEKDPKYFRLTLWLTEDDKSPQARARHLEATNLVSAEMKVIKARLDNAGDVEFAAEMFLTTPGDFKASLPRILRGFDTALDKYRRKAAEER